MSLAKLSQSRGRFISVNLSLFRSRISVYSFSFISQQSAYRQISNSSYSDIFLMPKVVFIHLYLSLPEHYPFPPFKSYEAFCPTTHTASFPTNVPPLNICSFQFPLFWSLFRHIPKSSTFHYLLSAFSAPFFFPPVFLRTSPSLPLKITF